jgi:hypothetical protein
VTWFSDGVTSPTTMAFVRGLTATGLFSTIKVTHSWIDRHRSGSEMTKCVTVDGHKRGFCIKGDDHASEQAWFDRGRNVQS